LAQRVETLQTALQETQKSNALLLQRMQTMEDSMSSLGNRKRKRGGEKKGGGRPNVPLKTDLFTCISEDHYTCRIEQCPLPAIDKPRGTLTFYMHLRDHHPSQCKWVMEQERYTPTNKEVEQFYRTQSKNSIIPVAPTLTEEEEVFIVGSGVSLDVPAPDRVLRSATTRPPSLSSSTAGSFDISSDDETFPEVPARPRRTAEGYVKLDNDPTDKAKWAELKKLVSNDSVSKKSKAKKTTAVEWSKGDNMQYRIITNPAILDHPMLVRKKLEIKELTFTEEERMAHQYGEGHLYVIM
jgi:hypothetical protein